MLLMVQLLITFMLFYPLSLSDNLFISGVHSVIVLGMNGYCFSSKFCVDTELWENHCMLIANENQHIFSSCRV